VPVRSTFSALCAPRRAGPDASAKTSPGNPRTLQHRADAASPIVRLNRDGEREISQVRWGLVPFSAKDASIGSKMINARSETVATKPGFREAYKKARCLIPASGFYEWAKMADGSKQPVRIAMRDEEPFAFAELWSRGGRRMATKS